MNDLEAAGDVAFAVAALLAATARGPGDQPLRFFGWHGQPFETGD